MECVEWEGRAEQRDVVGCGTVEWNVLSGKVEYNRGMQNYASCVKPLANNSKMLILLGPGKIMAAATSKRKSPEGD